MLAQLRNVKKFKTFNVKKYHGTCECPSIVSVNFLAHTRIICAFALVLGTTVDCETLCRGVKDGDENGE